MNGLPEKSSSNRWQDVLAVLLLAGASGVLLATAPTAHDFWWSDAPRHALNGAFILDFLRALPLDEPYRWAVDYYLHYPALTILFYPPLFYVIEAGMFAVFGVGHVPAQATVAVFVFLLAIGVTRLARMFLPRWSASATGLLVIGLPEMAFWARQVMLDIPALAFTALSAGFFLRFLETDRRRDAVLTAVLAAAAIWTKLNAVFLLPVFAVTGLAERGHSFLRNRSVRLAGLVAICAATPLLYLTSEIGAANVQSVAGRSGDLSRWSLDAWTYYARLVPEQMGWPAAALALVGVGQLALTARRGPTERGRTVLVLTWLILAYGLFSSIGLKAPRLSLALLVPLSIASVVALHALLPGRLAAVAASTLAIGTFAYSLALRPVPYVAGYDQVADYVASTAPPNAVVMFHGRRDGNFVFALRARSARRDITVLRTDKLLLEVMAGERERGVRQASYAAADVDALVRNLGVDLVVLQPGFWVDLDQMMQFESLVLSPAFASVAQFPVIGPPIRDDHEIHVYRPTYPVLREQREVTIGMPMLGGTFRGRLDEP